MFKRSISSVRYDRPLLGKRMPKGDLAEVSTIILRHRNLRPGRGHFCRGRAIRLHPQTSDRITLRLKPCGGKQLQLIRIFWVCGSFSRKQTGRSVITPARRLNTVWQQ